MSRSHFSDYDQVTTGRCERALLTLLGDIGPWRDRIYLAGGLAPRYLTGTLPDGAPAHVGTTDVDIIIGLAVADEAPETYRALHQAGAAAAASPVARHPQVSEALTLLGARFADIAQDGPAAYAAFLASSDDAEENTRLRREAVATIRAFLDGFQQESGAPNTAP